MKASMSIAFERLDSIISIDKLLSLILAIWSASRFSVYPNTLSIAVYAECYTIRIIIVCLTVIFGH